MPPGETDTKEESAYALFKPAAASNCTGAHRTGGGTTERNNAVTDGVVAFCVAAVTLSNLLITIPFLSVNSSADRRLADIEGLGVALILVGTLCLGWRRRAPLIVLGISAAAFCASLMLGYPATRPIAPVIALYALAVVHSSLVTATAGTIVALFVALATAVQQGWGDDYDDRVVENLLLLLAACFLGYGVQLTRARKSVLLAQESRLAREHAAATQLALREEKSRIARELHDVVAHSVSVITAQAVGAQRVFDAEPELAREALRSIETSGRGALTEMRRLLGVLQIESGDPEIAPQPGLDQLPFLIGQMGRAGLPVQFRVSGPPRHLSHGVELSAYRIVQEALTNTLDHAGPAQASVELTYRPERLVVEISDNGRGFETGAAPGHGLIGMRQRTDMLGGELVVGPGSAGGVQVIASLPTDVLLG